MLKALLAHPLTKGLDIDDSQTTHLRQQIIQEKYFLRKIYEEWYQSMAASLPSGDGAVLELGAGGGFMSDFVPDLVLPKEHGVQPTRQLALQTLYEQERDGHDHVGTHELGALEPVALPVPADDRDRDRGQSHGDDLERIGAEQITSERRCGLSGAFSPFLAIVP